MPVMPALPDDTDIKLENIDPELMVSDSELLSMTSCTPYDFELQNIMPDIAIMTPMHIPPRRKRRKLDDAVQTTRKYVSDKKPRR